MCACRGTAGFAHVSCLAEQVKILFAEAEENHLDDKVMNARWHRWDKCSLCEQDYHGVVFCALGWACWKTYVGRPETDQARCLAMGLLGNGLHEAERHADALIVKEAELATKRRIGASENQLLVVQTNLAITYKRLGRSDQALRMNRDVYSGHLKLQGEEHVHTLTAALNYAASLIDLQRSEEAKSLLRKMMPVARRVLGETNDLTIRMRCSYAGTLYKDKGATLDDLRESVTTLEDLDRTARRVLGGEHPLTRRIEYELRLTRAALRAPEGDVESKFESVREAVEAMTPPGSA